MNLISIEAPVPRVPPTRETTKVLNAVFRIVVASQLSKVVTDQLL